MGFMDMFRKNKKKNIKSLPEPQNKDYQQKTDSRPSDNNEKVDVGIYSKRNGNSIEYSIKMRTKGEVIPVGKIERKENKDYTKEEISLKEIVGEIEDLMQPLGNSRNRYSLDKAKQNAIDRLGKMSSKYEQFSIAEEAMSYVQNYKPQDIDYIKLNELPKVIDVAKLSKEEINEYGEKLMKRLNTLDSIKTPDDAYKDREALISYMLEKENLPNNPIVDANVQSIEDGVGLDEDTVLRISQKWEEQLDNEDGALYSAYLKLEEKRILKKIYERLEAAIDINNQQDMQEARQEYKFVQHIKEQIESIQGGFSPQVLKIIIDSMKKMDIEIYTKEYKEKDEKLVEKINQNYPDIEDKQEILKYLYVRMGSLGQLSYRSDLDNGMRTLRDFVAYSEFKDEDNTESKEFLFIVAKIEKECIKNQCSQIINKYMENNKISDKNSFRERLKNINEPFRQQPIAEELSNTDRKESVEERIHE